MSSSWQAEYQKLGDYIKAHPEIEIEPNRMYIPKEARGEFNELFDRVREAFVDERYPELPAEVVKLSESYKIIEEEISQILGLNNISTLSVIKNFLMDPKNGLERAIYDHLFDLIKEKTDVISFIRQASETIDINMANLYQWGYEKWIVLAMLKMLAPSKIYRLVFDTDESTHLEETVNITIGMKEVYCVSKIPDFVIYSDKLAKYVFFKSELKDNINLFYGRSIPARELKDPADSSSLLGSRILLIHTTERAENMLIADPETRRVTSPDITLECPGKNELNDISFIEEIRNRNNLIKSIKGPYIALSESMPELSSFNLEDINYLEVGFDEQQLQPVIDVLADDTRNE